MSSFAPQNATCYTYIMEAVGEFICASEYYTCKAEVTVDHYT